MKKALHFQILITLVLGLAAGFARADLYGAAKAFEEKDFERSFQYR